jgi:hypothetical protein
MIVIGVYGTRRSNYSSHVPDIGVYFVMKNDVVVSIYFGHRWSGLLMVGYRAYLCGFYPDREVGIPMAAKAINEQANGECGLFYLGQEKADVMLILADRSVAWRECPQEIGSVVVGDEFIFAFDGGGRLTSVAADGMIANRSCTWETSSGEGIGVSNSIQLAFYSYGEDYVKSHVEAEDFLAGQGYAYTKYAYDMGAHSFFVCTVMIGPERELIFRWGIEEKET